jgi:hypothetical protein
MSSKLALAVVSLTLSLVALEVVIRAGDLFADARAATVDRAGDAAESPRETSNVFVQHPFLGYSGNPAHGQGLIDDVMLGRIFPDGPSTFYLDNRRINSHGFPSQYDDYVSVADGFHVGIFGGSVAEQLATAGGEALIAELESRFPELRGSVRIFNLAIGSYKQPQQLINLILMALQGVRFDVVVNLDGFNEVALSGADVKFHYNPLFPSRRQYLLMLKLRPEAMSGRFIEQYAEVIRERRLAAQWRASADRPLLAHSALARSVIGSLVLRHRKRARLLEDEMQQDESLPSDLLTYEPPCLKDEHENCWGLITEIWEQSSLQMAGIARQIGAQYIHVLQPSQYLEGSKPLTPREREIAYRPGQNWVRKVRRGYPLLQLRIPGMNAQGVAVRDLTALFADDEDDIYVDTCCHYNLRGSSAIARAIAREIRLPERPVGAESPRPHRASAARLGRR